MKMKTTSIRAREVSTEADNRVSIIEREFRLFAESSEILARNARA